MHGGPLKTFKSSLRALSLNLCRPRKPSRQPPDCQVACMPFIFHKRRSPIIKHLHLYNPPTSTPKTSSFSTILNAMKTISQFIKGKRTRQEARMSEAPEDESCWPSATEESSFASEIEDAEPWLLRYRMDLDAGAKGNSNQVSSSNANKLLLYALLFSWFLDHESSF